MQEHGRTLPTLKIRSDTGCLVGADVTLGEHRIPGLQELDLEMRCGDVNRVYLTVGVGDVDIDADTLAALEAYLDSREE